jgi:NADH-quinone oxidoreductase subunit C
LPDETSTEADAAETPPEAEIPTEKAPEPDPQLAAMFEQLSAALGDSVVDHAESFGNLVVRVRRDAWRRAAEVARTDLDCDFLSFVSAIDWQPAPKVEGDEGGDTSAPVQPTEMTFGTAGSEGRFQVFAHVASSRKHHGVTLKADLSDDAPRVESWVSVYAGADWHERECWEMYGVTFDGHPSLRHLYLPGEFEGHPLRKDFPLLARDVKPWPGLVDVEPMPGEDADEDSTEESS